MPTVIGIDVYTQTATNTAFVASVQLDSTRMVIFYNDVDPTTFVGTARVRVAQVDPVALTITLGTAVTVNPTAGFSARGHLTDTDEVTFGWTDFTSPPSVHYVKKSVLTVDGLTITLGTATTIATLPTAAQIGASPFPSVINGDPGDLSWSGPNLSAVAPDGTLIWNRKYSNNYGASEITQEVDIMADAALLERIPNAGPGAGGDTSQRGTYMLGAGATNGARFVTINASMYLAGLRTRYLTSDAGRIFLRPWNGSILGAELFTYQPVPDFSQVFQGDVCQADGDRVLVVGNKQIIYAEIDGTILDVDTESFGQSVAYLGDNRFLRLKLTGTAGTGPQVMALQSGQIVDDFQGASAAVGLHMYTVDSDNVMTVGSGPGSPVGSMKIHLIHLVNAVAVTWRLDVGAPGAVPTWSAGVVRHL